MAKPNESSLLQPAFLASWKEIAVYLSKGVRTVQRWEGQFGLPVERLSRGRIRVSRTKLDRWLNDNFSARQQMPPANSGQRTFPVLKLIDESQQLKAENRELHKQIRQATRKLLEEIESLDDLCAENSEKIPVQQTYPQGTKADRRDSISLPPVRHVKAGRFT